MTRGPLPKFHWLVYVIFAFVVMFAGSVARSQILGFSVKDGLVGALLGIGLITITIIVIWLCGRYDDRHMPMGRDRPMTITPTAKRRERWWTYAWAIVVALAASLFALNLIVGLSRGQGFVEALRWGLFGSAAVLLFFLPLLLLGRQRSRDEVPPGTLTDDIRSEATRDGPACRPPG